VHIARATLLVNRRSTHSCAPTPSNTPPLNTQDAFPLPLASSNGFNRHATLLLYLNNVPSGGVTRFDHLDLSVQPRRGRALIFFPSFADGTPDARTLHTATTARDVKWVSQQWVARGYRRAGGGGAGGKASRQERRAAVAAAAGGGQKQAQGAEPAVVVETTVVSVPASDGTLGGKKKGGKQKRSGFGGR